MKKIVAALLTLSLLLLCGCKINVTNHPTATQTQTDTQTVSETEIPSEPVSVFEEDGLVFNDYGDYLTLEKYTGTNKRLIINEKYNDKPVKDIADAFKNNQYVKTLYLNCSIETITSGAFYNCVYLSRIYLPEGLKTIEAQAFMGCSRLRRIYIPESVTKIEDDAFRFCTDLVVEGVPGSTAETFADKFRSIYFEDTNATTVKNSSTIILAETVTTISK